MFYRNLITALVICAPATAMAGDGTAFVFGNKPKAKSYAATSNYTQNPRDKPVNISRKNIGTYQVLIRGLGSVANGGNIQVSSYGNGPAMCKIDNWAAAGKDLRARVKCFSGQRPADSPFTLLFTPSRGVAAVRHAWAGKPKAKRYTADKKYSANENKGVTITRARQGSYKVTFAGVSKSEAEGGNVQVTAYGNGPAFCKVNRWNAGANALSVNVDCYSGSALTDSQFTVLFTPAG